MSEPLQFVSETKIEVEDLGISAADEAIGIVDVRCITINRLTIVVVETADGLTVPGYSAPWPWQRHLPMLGQLHARQNALESLMRKREKMARRAWKGPK